MKFEYACNTNVGRRRRNEDFMGVEQGNGTLAAVVADGVGGSRNGHAASRMAVEGILSALAREPLEEDTLLLTLIETSRKLFQSDIDGMTTAAVLWLSESQSTAVAAHLGDSRIYQFRAGKILYQSVDHSSVQMAVLVGELGPEALRTHKSRNLIYRALGDGKEPKPDSTELDIRPGDRFLLCSDGFWEPVLEEDMLETMASTATAEQWLQAMTAIVEAKQDPTQDNYTAVCILAKEP